MDYNLAQEQTNLSLAIQDARRELNALQVEKESFLLEREKESTMRLKGALEQAQDMVKETNEYVAVVQQMVREAKRIAEEIKALRSSLQDERRSFNEQTEQARTQLDLKAKELQDFSATVRLEKEKLDGELLQIQMARSSLNEQQRSVDGKRKMLAYALQVAQKKGVDTTSYDSSSA